MSNNIKLHFIEKFSEGDINGQLEAMREVFTLTDAVECDVLYCASVAKVSEALHLKKTLDKPLVVYCWDYYKWVHEKGNPNFDWKSYRELLKLADLVLVPSLGQQLRLKELLDVESVVCECSVNFYNHKTKDENYVLDPVRDYPEENLGWVEKACGELNIPYVHTEHSKTEEEFRTLVSNCTFLTCAYREASTGGLSLMEGLYNGKLSLVSNSPYMGARDYLGSCGVYFQYDSYEDLKDKIKTMWETRPKIDKKVARSHCANFTHKAFADRLKENILCVLNKN